MNCSFHLKVLLFFLSFLFLKVSSLLYDHPFSVCKSTRIVIFFSFLVGIVYCFLFKMLRSWNYNVILTSIVLILVIVSSQMHWLARPHIFSILFILLWYYLLDAYQYKNQKTILYFQIPLMLLWVNMHGGFILGLILNGIYLFGNMVEFILSSDPKRDKHKRTN